MSFELILMSWQSLLSKKSRTILSGIGITIGVFVVILVSVVGGIATDQINKQFESLNVTSLMALPVNSATSESKMDVEDIDYILEKSVFIDRGTTMLSGTGKASYGAEESSYSLEGVGEDYFSLSNLNLQKGRFLAQFDIDTRSRNVVIGATVLEDLFPDKTAEFAIEKEIFVARKRMKIVGILKEVGSTGFINNDKSIFMAYTTAESQILGEAGEIKFSLTARSSNVLSLAERELGILLREVHKLEEGDDDDFRIMNMGALISSATGVADILSILLTAVAAIILLVSGIGIMNVMFVTVSERTKEIGVLKAIGAQKKDILLQFLIESVSLCLIAGIVGIILGVITTLFLIRFGAVISFTSIGIAFAFSLFVGVVFGFYPALKASRLDPIDALRSD